MVDSKATDSHKKVRPILRWAGSKRQLVPALIKYYDSNDARYVEPFAGSCSLFFEANPKQALISDKNSELIRMYQVLREQPRELHYEVARYPVASDFYGTIREKDPDSLPDLERAARFVYLNRNCFNGIYRTNSEGRFNVPFAPTKTGALPSAEEFEACAIRLNAATIRNWDFGTTLRYVRRGDFVYLDPPYAVSSRRVFTAYGPKEFSTADLGRLAQHLQNLHKKGAYFLLSYADCKEIRMIATNWSSRRVRVRRNVAGFSGARRSAYEVLVTNRSNQQ